LIIDVLYCNKKNVKLIISLELLFHRIANNKYMQKIMYFSLNPVLYNEEERKFYKYVRSTRVIINYI